MSDGSGYLEARRLLNRRYGDPDSVSSAFVDILTDWNSIKPGDVDSLDKFSIALTSCLNVMKDIPPGSRETDHPRTMRKIVEKLPYHCQDSWRNRVIQIKEEANRKVTFEDIVVFVDREVRKITDPTFGKLTKPDGSGKKPHIVSATGVNKDASPRVMTCLYCAEQHSTDSCERLNHEPYEKRRTFIVEQRLCFGCLRQRHQISVCTKRLSCKICKGRHPTPLHNDKQASPSEFSATSKQSSGSSAGPAAVVRNGRLEIDGAEVAAGARGDSSTMMAVIPVLVRSPDGSRSVVTHAFLDLGSSATFCTDLLLKRLNVKGKATRLTMMTAASENQSVQCQVVEGLSITGLHSSTAVQLPPTYTLERIPVKHEDIATPADIGKWMHLEGIPLTQVDAEIGLMIGGNCPEALCPLEVRRGGEGEPFAFRSELGWAVYGPRELRSTRDHGAARVNRVSVLRGDSDIHEKFVSLYNKEFEDNGSSTDVGLSVEDRVWLKTVESGTNADGRIAPHAVVRGRVNTEFDSNHHRLR
ncbi:uncharacterized protein LOC122372129 [Amphibalanus amphitrite]|uniref:uncharacterized protein LOC122372129 n=1 Tax=Amphibalanus amphitrite TaxID=1232801 RepID=UPI001C8FF716|nr:uncharacterized protein LOC122372129 [Amphibalanus amphitrite]